jgi:hypothetical protein
MINFLLLYGSDCRELDKWSVIAGEISENFSIFDISGGEWRGSFVALN